MPAQNGSKVKDSSRAQADEFEGENGLLRELKGAPLSVLLALEIYGAQGRVELVEHTGWSYSAVQGAMKKLEEMDLVCRLNYRSWTLVDGVTLVTLPSSSRIPEMVSNNTSHNEVVSDNSSESNMVAGSGSGSDAEVTSRTISVVEKTGEVFTENTSGAEVVSKNTSAPHDYDGVIDTKEHNSQNKHHSSKTTMTTLARALKALDPPFENARRWLQDASPQLVQGWLDYLQNLDRESRRRIRNEAAFLRWKVESEEEPPPPPKHRVPCKRCNKAIRDAQGRCLVCLGLVAV